ncbi:MAG: GNAT family N-acetyltransferase, partial [Proteobacteria bacterium]|nr:GNAT family N-acetyltransferase [Pseudomonadota bacterium]
MPQTSVRKATRADRAPLIQSLARAFYTDPVFSYFIPDDCARLKKLESVFGILFKLGLPHGACYTTDNYESITLWRPPNEWDVPFSAYIANGPALLSAFGGGILRVLSTMGKMEKIHPHIPHWYLQAIGTDPAFQGKGYGGVIMRDRLAQVDAAHMPCYLESSKDTNIPIYKSFGFEVTGEIQVPGGPKVWPMWR